MAAPDKVARGLSKMMREELSEKVETVFAEEYAWPLGLALLLLVLEAAISESPLNKRAHALPLPARRRKKKRGTREKGEAHAAL